MTPSDDPLTTYHNRLLALAYLGLPLVTPPEGVETRIDPRVFRDLEIGLLRVQCAVMGEQIALIDQREAQSQPS